MAKKKIQKQDPKPFAYKRIINPRTGERNLIRVVSPRIPDNILATGNLQTLEKFYNDHKDTLTEADKKYMHARLHTAKKLDRLEKQAKKNIGNNVPINKLQVRIARNKGYSTINLKLPESQTSSNGCWSCGMSLLLKSRGVDLSQEEIRAFRPEFPEGQENQMPAERRHNMDLDTSGNVYDSADLVHKVLPNTAVNCVTLTSLPEDFEFTGKDVNPDMVSEVYFNMTAEQQRASDRRAAEENARQKKAFEKAFKKQCKKQFTDLVRQAIEKDQSPVVLNTGNHFVTITGISAHGNKLRVEDSFRSKNSTTQYISVDDLINQTMMHNKQGLTLTWLKDINPPSYEQRQNETVDAAPSYPDCCSVDQDTGNITICENENHQTVSARKDPRLNIGQLKGQELSDSIPLDQTKIKEDFGGKQINYLQDGDVYYLGSVQTYLPKKVYYKGDPELNNIEVPAEKDEHYEDQQAGANRQAGENQQAGQAPDLDAVGAGLDPNRPLNGTFGAYLYDQQQEIYRESEDQALYLARIYAVHKVMGNAENAGMEKVITPDDQQAIETMTGRIMPVISGYLDTETGKIELPVSAVKDDPAEFVGSIDRFCNAFSAAAEQNSKNKEERLTAIDDAYKALESTGTGKYYFGIRRSRNTTEFDSMMDEIRAYRDKLKPESNETPDGIDAYNVVRKCLTYINDKKSLRSTPSGQLRVDAVMNVLRQLMPAKEFQALCTKMNRARELNASPADKNYSSPSRYALQTCTNFIKHKSASLTRLSGSELTDSLAQILAARRIAGNEPTGFDFVVKHINEKNSDMTALKQETRAIKNDPAFRQLITRIQESSPGDRRALIQSFAGSVNGAALETSFNQERQGVQIRSGGPGI